ncbi:MAG: hypothetical protein A3F83_09355 [Candidatus Glassbacteria bacterium RIFCSPLOWO2_12_FULL_58_11]|uniref:DUF2490 domain-containing protein n=2 Tax=Candidatus Glassiibacteriota TaxID=1817805 RepID=A0A1F5YTR8_9BACT|nr:MAG: hypothetical protein A2Z86_09205 [Candidatus Glassbacteria bacterium GWA2_58_10]OGG03367.1 MAG: hypothetical protein A3F83_09355 [Candidatus Glassbacteria bacterium RIFCSPLOWO2_12_FULL_58_11]
MLLSFIAVYHPAVTAGQNQMIQRLEQKLYWQASERFELRGFLQSRFQDMLSDFYYFNWDAGVSTYVNDRFKVPVCFRQTRREFGTDWQTTNYLLFDPTVLLVSAGGWQLDLRGRCTYMLTGTAVENIRLRPQASYVFLRRNREVGWYIYNDFYFQVLRQERLDHARFNLFAAGLRYPLNPVAGLDLRYMLFSAKYHQGAPWSHLHETCVVLEFRI